MGADPKVMRPPLPDGDCAINFTPFTVALGPAVTAAKSVPPARTSDGRPVSFTHAAQVISAALARDDAPIEIAAAAAIVSKTRIALVQFPSSGRFCPIPEFVENYRASIADGLRRHAARRDQPSVILLIRWSGRPGSNRRHSAWEADVLPLNYSRPRQNCGTPKYSKIDRERCRFG